MFENKMKKFNEYINEGNTEDGIWVHVQSTIDAKKLQKFIDKNSKYKAKWDYNVGAFWFPADVSTWDKLQDTLHKRLNTQGIDSFWFDEGI
jgi:hypothetical protein